MHVPLNAEDSESPWGPWNDFATKISLSRGNLTRSWVSLWCLSRFTKPHVLSMGVTQLAPTLTVRTGRCHPHSPSAALPHLPGTDMPSSGTKDHKSDNTGIIPPCNAAFRFVTGDGSGHEAFPAAHPHREQTTDNKLQRKSSKAFWINTLCRRANLTAHLTFHQQQSLMSYESTAQAIRNNSIFKALCKLLYSLAMLLSVLKKVNILLTLLKYYDLLFWNLPVKSERTKTFFLERKGGINPLLSFISCLFFRRESKNLKVFCIKMKTRFSRLFRNVLPIIL